MNILYFIFAIISFVLGLYTYNLILKNAEGDKTNATDDAKNVIALSTKIDDLEKKVASNADSTKYDILQSSISSLNNSVTTLQGQVTVKPSVKVTGKPGGGNWATNGPANIILPSVQFDVDGMFDQPTGVATIKQAGIYLVQCQFFLVNSGSMTTDVIVNGLSVGRLMQSYPTSNMANGTSVITVKAGDKVSLQTFNVTIYAADFQTSQWSLSKIN